MGAVDTTQESLIVQLLDDVVGTRNRSQVIRRLRWIEDRLWWIGTLRRQEVVERFEISPQQASSDIAAYQHARTGVAKLDSSLKAYVRQEETSPLFPKDPWRWITEEMTEGAKVLPMERVPLPGRRVDPGIMAALLSAFDARQPVKICYQSLSRDEPAERVICPQCIVDAGVRHHVRAWDGLRGQFADFVLGRILSTTPEPDYPWVDALADRAWHEMAEIMLVPSKGLTAAQRRTVERDYGMMDGRIALPVRQAMVTYAAEALGVLDEIQGKPPNGRRDIRCLNARDLTKFVPPSMDGEITNEA